MKRIIFLLLLLSSVVFGQVDGPMKYYYASGKLSSEGNFKNGQPDGYWKSYYENGNVKSEGNRLNGQLIVYGVFIMKKEKKTSDINYRNNIKVDGSTIIFQPVKYIFNVGW
ncbi:MAG: hypothetical protein IPJ26_03965 [Bacteroidetes bacterium]|nr:hypothetical protein [Bacteroidota bacterium]